MKILLIGASSYVGARLFRDLRNDYNVVGTYNHTSLLPDFIKLDITDASAVRELIATQKPDVIIHTANNASIKWCEAHPEEAKVLNKDSTQTIARAANEVGAKVIYISSFAAIKADDIYGRTKLASEELTKQVTNGWLVIRPSLIVGYSPNTVNDRFFNRILWNIDKHTEATYDTSWKMQLTSLSHLSKTISALLTRGILNKIIPVAVDEAKSRYDFAKDILTPFGIEVSTVDGGHTTPELHEDLSLLVELGLPTHSYAEMIDTITTELHNREALSL